MSTEYLNYRQTAIISMDKGENKKIQLSISIFWIRIILNKRKSQHPLPRNMTQIFSREKWFGIGIQVGQIVSAKQFKYYSMDQL